MSHLIKIYPPVLNVSADHEELVQAEESHCGSGDKIEEFKEIFRDSDLVTSASSFLNPLYTGGLFHCYTCMLDESICHFRGVRSVLFLLFYFPWKILLAYNVDPDQMPHYVASDLGLPCLPKSLLRASR